MSIIRDSFLAGLLIVAGSAGAAFAAGNAEDGVAAGLRKGGIGRERIRPPDLATSLSFSATNVSVGQRFEVVLEVRNKGLTESGEMTLQDLVWSGPGRVASVRQAAQAGPERLPPGAVRTFIWEYAAVGRGPVRFTAKLAVTDAAGQSRSMRARSHGPLRIQDPPSLAATLSAEPAEVCRGQEFRVTLSLTNRGEATAIGVLPGAVLVSGPGSTTALAGPYPGEPRALAGNESVSWTWTLAGGDSGGTFLTCTAGGIDANTGDPVPDAESAAAWLKVSEPPALAVQIGSRPRASVGQWITACLTVSNTGGAPASGLLPELEVESGEAALLAAPRPAGIGALLPGASKTLCWTYSVGGAGPIAFRANAAGFACGGAALSASCFSTIVSQRPARLRAVLDVSATSVVIGQPVRVSLTVTDDGEADARGVRPELMECFGPAIRISPHPYGFRSLGPEEGTSYDWTYSPSGSGEVFWSVRARGIDGNSGVPVMTEWFKSSPVRVFAPAEVSIKSLRLLPGGAVEQEAFVQAFLVIGNDGEADAQIEKITIKELVSEAFKKKHPKAKPTLTGWFAPNVAFPVPVGGGKAAVIMWTYRAINTGPTYVTVSAEGTESLTGRKIAIPEMVSNEVLVEEPAKTEEEKD